MNKLITNAILHSSVWSSVWRNVFCHFSSIDYIFDSVDSIGASGMFNFIRDAVEDSMNETINEMNKR